MGEPVSSYQSQRETQLPSLSFGSCLELITCNKPSLVTFLGLSEWLLRHAVVFWFPVLCLGVCCVNWENGREPAPLKNACYL